jgi:hypothetical protein
MIFGGFLVFLLQSPENIKNTNTREKKMLNYNEAKGLTIAN